MNSETLLKIKNMIVYGVTSLTILIMVYTLASNPGVNYPTIPSRQLEEITFSTNLLSTRDPFTNLILNLRISELYIYALAITLLLSTMFKQRVYRVILRAICLISLLTVIIYDLAGYPPFNTIPSITNDNLQLFVFTALITVSIISTLLYTIWNRNRLQIDRVFLNLALYILAVTILIALLYIIGFREYIVIYINLYLALNMYILSLSGRVDT